jgi:hypothetical protein
LQLGVLLILPFRKLLNYVVDRRRRQYFLLELTKQNSFQVFMPNS